MIRLILIITAILALTNAQRKCPYANYAQYEPDLEQNISGAAIYTTNSLTTPTESIPSNGVSYNSLDAFLRSLISSDAIFDRPIRAENQYTNTKNVVFKQKEPLTCAIPPLNCPNDALYYRSLDGSCNNLQYPGLGMAKSRYARILPPNYSDGAYSPTISVTGVPLPNARFLSLSVYGEESVPDDFRTMALLQWGQLVAHDCSLFTKNGAPDDCCVEAYNKRCYPISLLPYGPISSGSGNSCLNFARSTSDYDAVCPNSGLPYSEKISLVTPYLDLSSIYGNSLKESQETRQFQGGLLKTSFSNDRHWLPIKDNGCAGDNQQCYGIPDKRNRFTPTIATLHTLILREHNRIALILSQLNPHYSDERLFQECRKIVIAEFQKITFYEWLPLIIGTSFAYANSLIYDFNINQYVDDYDETVDVAPYAAYATAAFRYGHHQIPGVFSLVSPNRAYNQTMRLSDYFNLPELQKFIADAGNFDALILGLTTQLQKRSDGNIDREIKHYFNRKPFNQYGEDLKAFDVQRGRDFGLRSYNDYRTYCGLPRAYAWSDFSREISTDKIAILQNLYASPDDVDLVLGGSLEAHAPEALLGPTFQCIVGKQFLKLRVGDRFFFERENQLSGFTITQLAEIRKTSFAALICNNGDYLQYIQPNPFISPNIRNPLINCNAIPKIDLSKWIDVQQQQVY